MKDRHYIIDISVQVEYNISLFLAKWLDIKRDSSRSLGTKSSRLSFMQQINLILDMNILNKEQAEKLEYFARIRNKFAHFVEIKTFEQCLNSEVSLKNGISKYYPLKNSMNADLDSREQIVSLLSDITIITEQLLIKLEAKLN